MPTANAINQQHGQSQARANVAAPVIPNAIECGKVMACMADKNHQQGHEAHQAAHPTTGLIGHLIASLDQPVHDQPIACIGQHHAKTKARGQQHNHPNATQLMPFCSHQTGLCQGVKRDRKCEANPHGVGKRPQGFQDDALQRAADVLMLMR